jgi:hypothetical protein
MFAATQVRGILAERVIVSAPGDPSLSLKAAANHTSLSVRTLRKFIELPPDDFTSSRVAVAGAGGRRSALRNFDSGRRRKKNSRGTYGAAQIQLDTSSAGQKSGVTRSPGGITSANARPQSPQIRRSASPGRMEHRAAGDAPESPQTPPRCARAR